MYRQKFHPHFTAFGYSIAIGTPTLSLTGGLCARVGRNIATWSQIDHQLGMLLGALIGAGGSVAIELFMSLRQTSAQIKTAKTAAKFTLAGDDLLICEALLKLYDELEDSRNDLAHGVFGTCGDDGEQFSWIAARDYVHFNVEALTQPSSAHDQLTSNIWVYSVNDLDQMLADFEELWWCIFDFNCYLRDKQGQLGQHHMHLLLGRPMLLERLPQLVGRRPPAV